ncbi:MAG TPA: succinyl-diaminopimelate desuccinylase, partial [Alphaproteobacteria bacterium]|nr:succinyl-diaminopimelate desuccinylase [Alphaproteobacteria bacterium]
MIDPIELTQALVRCPSVTPLDAGALDVVDHALHSLGFTVTRLRFFDEESDAVDNLFARLGIEGPHLCFLGHTDVVPVGTEGDWVHPP